MATFLYRLGRFSFRRRWIVAPLWLALLVAAGIAGSGLAGETSDAFSIPGTESQRAVDLLAERFPQARADGATARVVFAAPPGQRLTDPGHRAAIQRLVADLAAAPQVGEVSDPFGDGGQGGGQGGKAGQISPDGQIGYAQVSYRVPVGELTEPARDALAGIAATGREAGLTVELGGDAVRAERDTGRSEVIGLAVAAVVLLVTFGSLVAAGLPLLTALIGIGFGIAAITAATGFVELSSTTPTLALMIGLAVAIDYALFIVSRYRSEVAAGHDREEATGRALGTAGTAVTFAGLTVIVALTGLLVVDIPILSQMGLAAAFTVVVAVLIALTLLPALLGIFGRRVLSGRRTAAAASVVEDRRPTLGRRWAGLVTRHPVPVLVVAVLALAVVALPVFGLRLGLPDDRTAPPDSTERKAYDLLAEGFGPGFNGPLTVVVDAAGAGTDPGAATDRVAAAIAAVDNVAAVSPARFAPSGDLAVLTVVPGSDPGSEPTEQLVTELRERAGGWRDQTGAAVAVTGQTATNIDVSDRLASAIVPYVLIVVGLAFILLMLVFRSILIPLTATVGFLVSVTGATFGAVVAVFQWGWFAGLLGIEETAPIVSLLPVFLIGVVFGLAMDYQIFLVSRMREAYVHGADPTEAVITGYSLGARVVTAAAIIMISVFAGFLLSDQDLVKQMGFALAVSVVFDAFVVRTTIVPALMALLGRSAWWLPRWLDRILPDVDVEGDRLLRPAGPDHPPPDARLRFSVGPRRSVP